MREFLRKKRRDHWRDQVIANGERLRELEVSRAGISSTLWPDVTEEIDAEIDRRIRRRDGLLTKLRETA